MKKVAKHLLRSGIILLALSLFFSLCLSDVYRLYPDVESDTASISRDTLASVVNSDRASEGDAARLKEMFPDVSVEVIPDVPKAREIQLKFPNKVTQAKVLMTSEKENVAVPVSEMPALEVNEGDVTNFDGSVAMLEGEIITVANKDYTIVGYDLFTTSGGQFKLDKFKTNYLIITDKAGNEYTYGTVYVHSAHWDSMNFLQKLALILQPFILICEILAVALIIAAVVCFFLNAYKESREKSIGAYLGVLFKKYCRLAAWFLMIACVLGALFFTVTSVYTFSYSAMDDSVISRTREAFTRPFRDFAAVDAVRENTEKDSALAYDQLSRAIDAEYAARLALEAQPDETPAEDEVPADAESKEEPVSEAYNWYLNEKAKAADEYAAVLGAPAQYDGRTLAAFMLSSGDENKLAAVGEVVLALRESGKRDPAIAKALGVDSSALPDPEKYPVVRAESDGTSAEDARAAMKSAGNALQSAVANDTNRVKVIGGLILLGLALVSAVGAFLLRKFVIKKDVLAAKARKVISDNAIICGIVLLAVFVRLNKDAFFSESNIRNLLSNTAVRFIIASGVSGCLITKGTDLSAGRMTGFAACLSAIFLQRAGTYSNKFYPGLGNLPIIPVLLGVVAICAILGAINGTVISVLKVPPFIATLGMQTLVYGACMVYTGSEPIGTLQPAYTGIAQGYFGNRIFSYIAIIALCIGLIMWFLYNKTRYGKHMYAIGGNETAAEVAGINTIKSKIKIYALAACLYALTGFLMASKSGGASVNTAQGYELEAIAGCTIGGVSVNGGVGKISGILVGVLVFELLKIALQWLGIPSEYTYVAQGLVIILAVALDLRKYLAKK